jgi:hypothetical protein
LSGLEELKRLYLDEVKLKDYSVISHFRLLEILSLSKTNFSDLSVLKKLKKLTRLDLTRSDVSDLLPLYGLKSLKELCLAGTWLFGQKVKDLKKNLPGCKVISGFGSYIHRDVFIGEGR